MNAFVSLWTKVSNFGVADHVPVAQKSSIRISNQISLIIIVISIVYFIYGRLFITESSGITSIQFDIFHLGIILCFSIVWILNRYGKVKSAKALLLSIVFILLFLNAWMHKQPYRTEPYLFALAALSFVMFEKTYAVIAITILFAAAYYVLAYRTIGELPNLADVKEGLAIRVALYFSLLIFILYFLRQETDKANEELEVKSAQLLSEKDNIEKINFTKDKIFSIISHDLRSPIGSLKTSLELLQSDALSIDEFKKVTGDLEKRVNQLHKSLNEMLIWSRAQLHGVEPHPTTYTIRPLAYEVMNMHKLVARNKKIILTANIPQDDVVFCDRDMLKSVLSNLVNNAIKFTPSGGAVSIFTKGNNGHAEICVEDTGVGIPDEAKSKIFSQTAHYSTSGTNNEKGTGLGLIMCKEFIEKNEGKLTLHSELEIGTCFTITLPRDQSEDA